MMKDRKVSLYNGLLLKMIWMEKTSQLSLDFIRSDSPTAGKDSLKLALIVAANKGIKVKSADVKSAYIQGLDLQRQILVQPPPEEENIEDKLW